MAAKRKKHAENRVTVWYRIRRISSGCLSAPLCAYDRGIEGTYEDAGARFAEECLWLPDETEVLLLLDGVEHARGGRLQLREGEKRLEAEDCR